MGECDCTPSVKANLLGDGIDDTFVSAGAGDRRCAISVWRHSNLPRLTVFDLSWVRFMHQDPS